MFKRILWATDFSEHATLARDWAAQCAECSGGKPFALLVEELRIQMIVLGAYGKRGLVMISR